jgi:uncharacterized protein (DUF983 family)
MKTHISSLLALRCPHCNESKLLKPKSWFEFEPGCTRCNYRYEREEGYFWGAPWMINYPISAAAAIFLGIELKQSFGLSSLKLASAISLVTIALAVAIYPHARALWMIGDHMFHPLSEKDRLSDDKPLAK